MELKWNNKGIIIERRGININIKNYFQNISRRKTMKELIEDKHTQHQRELNELRKKWLPEKYNPNFNK